MKHRSAYHEVAVKSSATIERETAKKWAERAVACYQRYIETCKPNWLQRAFDYRHEALEHAAIVGDRGKFVAKIQYLIDDAFNRRVRS